MTQSKLRLFLENFFVYGFGGIISKVIPLLMVPIITRLMPSSFYFGVSDLANTLMSFCMALAILGMYDAMYRLFFEYEDTKYKQEICSTTLFFTLLLSFVVSFLMCVFRDQLAIFVFDDKTLSWLVCLTALTTFVGVTNGIISAPTRMQNKRKVFLAMNTLAPLISYGISIPLLLEGHYLLALPLSAFVSAILQEAIFYWLNKNWFQLHYFNKKYLLPLLKIALPLMPNFIVYWIFNSSDKLMIAHLLDTSEVGIYAVGSKLGHASQLIYTAFAGGWQFFAFSTMKEQDQVKNNSTVFEYLGLISFISTMFIFAFSRNFYQLLFVGEYVRGFIIAPYLFLAPLLLMLYQVVANQFLVVQNTLPSLFILFAGAASNIILNFLLIPIRGIEGAAVATLIGYVISVTTCATVLCKMKLHIITIRFLIISTLMFVYILLWRFYMITSTTLAVSVAILFSVVMLTLYYGEIKSSVR